MAPMKELISQVCKLRRLEDDERPHPVIWWLAGGRSKRGLPNRGIPTAAALRERKTVEEENREAVGFWGTVVGRRKVKKTREASDASGGYAASPAAEEGDAAPDPAQEFYPAPDTAQEGYPQPDLGQGWNPAPDLGQGGHLAPDFAQGGYPVPDPGQGYQPHGDRGQAG